MTERAGLVGIVAMTGTFTDARLADLIFALNASALVLWELLTHRGVRWMGGRTFPRVVSLLALAPVLVSSLILILEPMLVGESGWHVLSLLLFLGFASLSLFYFRFRVRDLFILTVCLLGGIMMVTSLVARLGGENYWMGLVIAALVVGQTTGAALWLRRVAQGWEDAG